MTSLDHVRYLAEGIGPRSGTSEEEGKAATYVQSQLTALGLEAQTQSFLSASYPYAPYILFAGLGLLSLWLFWQAQPVGAAAGLILTVMAIVSLWLEVRFQTNPLRWLLPIEQSQNVHARIAPPAQPSQQVVPRDGDDRQQEIVITTYLDVRRRPEVFHSLGGDRAFPAFVWAGLISAAILAVLFAIGIVEPARLLRQVALIPGAVVLAMLIVMILAESAPYSKSSDDNTGSLAVLLGLAGRLKEAPLQRTAVTLVFTGSEEAGCYGAEAYLREHAAESKRTIHGYIHLAVERLGLAGTNPAVVSAQRFLDLLPADADLLARANAVMAAHTEWNGGRVTLRGRGEMAVGARYGLRVMGISSTPPTAGITGVTGVTVDEQAMDRGQSFLWELLQALDAKTVG